MRALNKLAVLKNLQEDLPKKCIEDSQIRIVYFAIMLLLLFKIREAARESCKQYKNPKTLTQQEEKKMAVLILDVLSREPSST